MEQPGSRAGGAGSDVAAAIHRQLPSAAMIACRRLQAVLQEHWRHVYASETSDHHPWGSCAWRKRPLVHAAPVTHQLRQIRSSLTLGLEHRDELLAQAGPSWQARRPRPPGSCCVAAAVVSAAARARRASPTLKPNEHDDIDELADTFEMSINVGWTGGPQKSLTIISHLTCWWLLVVASEAPGSPLLCPSWRLLTSPNQRLNVYV